MYPNIPIAHASNSYSQKIFPSDCFVTAISPEVNGSRPCVAFATCQAPPMEIPIAVVSPAAAKHGEFEGPDLLTTKNYSSRTHVTHVPIGN